MNKENLCIGFVLFVLFVVAMKNPSYWSGRKDLAACQFFRCVKVIK